MFDERYYVITGVFEKSFVATVLGRLKRVTGILISRYLEESMRVMRSILLEWMSEIITKLSYPISPDLIFLQSNLSSKKVSFYLVKKKA